MSQEHKLDFLVVEPAAFVRAIQRLGLLISVVSIPQEEEIA